MKYVLDVSVTLSCAIPRSHSPKALRLRNSYQQGLHELIAPSHFVGELASALTKAQRQKLIPVGDAQVHFANQMAFAPLLTPYEPFTTRAIEISSRYRCGFYDALYVALSEQEKCEVVSADDRMVNALQATFPFVIHLNSMP